MSADRTPSEELGSRNEELLAENARLREVIASRDSFLAIAAHELRNPMTPIVGRVSYLRRMISKSDVSLEKIEKNLEQIEWLISRYVQRATILLDMSRINTGKFKFDPTLFDVCELIREIVENVRPPAEQSGSTFDLELPAEGLIIHGDRLSLEQIIDNLISNAIKYGGGTPILVSATADADKNVAVICVSDNGPGIAPADQTRIFDRFERAVRPGDRASGFGVGLWIVRELTEAMGGTILLNSKPGNGATFTITMPRKLAKDT